MVRPIRVLTFIGAPRATLQRLRFLSRFIYVCSRMDTLMRTLKLLALGVLFAMGAALPVNAQTPDRRRLPVLLQRQLRRAMEGTDLHRQLDVHYLQRADRRGGGCTLDWRRNTVRCRRWARASGRASASGSRTPTITNHNDAAVSVRVPHPVVFGQPRTATATAPISSTLRTWSICSSCGRFR